jgi:type I restriction enzyme S subunit
MFGDPTTNPKGWEVRRLGEISETATGGTPLRKKKEYWKNGTIPWIKSGEFNDNFIYDSEEKNNTTWFRKF